MRVLDLGGQPLDLDLTLACGQAFRWRKQENGVWRGVVRDRLIELKQDGCQVSYHTFPVEDEALVRDYLRLSDDVEAIYEQLEADDPHLGELTRQFRGLRLLRQDPTETLLSFVCSAANSIPRIMAAIEALAYEYGDIVCEHGGSCYYTFPSLAILITADDRDLFSTASLGFRGPNIKLVAQQIAQRGEDWLISLRGCDYKHARAELVALRGVGMKIADCTCLFSLDKDESVPVDTHVRQLAQRLWLTEMKSKTITDHVYRSIASEFHSRYGRLSGWAQQFLFYEDLLRTRALGRGLG